MKWRIWNLSDIKDYLNISSKKHKSLSTKSKIDLTYAYNYLTGKTLLLLIVIDLSNILWIYSYKESIKQGTQFSKKIY